MSDAKSIVMDLIFGRWRSQIVYTGVRLGVFDALAKAPVPAPVSSGTAAEAIGADPNALYRLLRALASLGLLTEHPGRNFTLTAAGELLRADHPDTLRGVTLLEEGPEHYAIWRHLPDMIREGKQNGFVREFGRMAFEYAHERAEYETVFNDAMSSYSSVQMAWALEAISHCDLGSVSRACDVAGGHGHMLCSFLAAHPGARGIVLELPSVLADTDKRWANRLGVADRCEFVGGDMFDAVPQADVYFLKMILHDWNDDECLHILSNIRNAASPQARVFIVEHLVPGPETPHFAKLFDIHMMCWGTGRERTAEEYTDLLTRSGWSAGGVHRSSGLMGVVEGRLAV